MKKIFGKMIALRILLMGTLLWLPLAAKAQDIKVISQNGMKVAKAGKTRVIFKTFKHQRVGIYELLSESSAYVVGYGGSASGHQVDLKPLCDAPAELELKNGFYNFHITNNAFLGASLKLDAEGGTQYWEVKNYNSGDFMNGVLLLAFGGGAAILGGCIFAVGSTNYDTGVTTNDPLWLVIGLAGVAGVVGGIFVMNDSVAGAKLLSVKF